MGRDPRLTLNEWDLVAVSDLLDNRVAVLAVPRLIACYRPEGLRRGRQSNPPIRS